VPYEPVNSISPADDLTERQRAVDTAGTPATARAPEWTCSRCNRDIRVGQQYVTEGGQRRHDPVPAACRRA